MSNLPKDLKYAATHEWARLEGEQTVRVGITDFAQESLGDLVFIQLPELGRIVQANEQCAVVESVKTAADLYSPVSGEITTVNSAVAEAPEKVNEDAFGTWLFCIKTDDVTALDKLMNAEDYQRMIEE